MAHMKTTPCCAPTAIRTASSPTIWKCTCSDPRVIDSSVLKPAGRGIRGRLFRGGDRQADGAGRGAAAGTRYRRRSRCAIVAAFRPSVPFSMRDSALPRLLSLSLLLSTGFIVAPSSAAAGCVPAVTAAKALAAPQAGLNAVLSGEADTDLTPAARDAIVALKHGLAGFVDVAAACLSDAVPKPDAFAQTLAAQAGNASPTPRFDVRLLQNDALLSVVARVDVPCGEDALWLLYERRDAQWQPVLQWTGAAYDRV